MSKLYQESIRRWYDKDYRDLRKGHPTVGEFKEQYWDRISHYFNKEINILDAGAGNGRFANFFGPFVKTVTAIDLWIPMNKEFKSENIYFYSQGLMDFATPQWMGNKKYDVIFMNGVLYLFNLKQTHTSDKTSFNLKKGGQLAAIHKIKSLLTQDGLLILIGARDRIVDGYNDEPGTPLGYLLEIAQEYAGRYDIPKICRENNFKVLGLFRHAGHNTHMTILQNSGDKE